MSELPLLSELPQEGKLPLSSELLPVAVRVILESSTLETSTWEPSVPTCQWEPSVLTWNPGQYQLGNLKNQFGLIPESSPESSPAGSPDGLLESSLDELLSRTGGELLPAIIS